MHIYSELAAELNTEDDGFRCPTQSTKVSDDKGQIVAHPKYPHETDCQKFYVCLNGIDKRPLGCPAGQVYNDATEMCDAPENVPGWLVLDLNIRLFYRNCHSHRKFSYSYSEDWYKEDSEDSKPSKKSRK